MDAEWTYVDIENFYDRVRLVLNGASNATLPDEYIDYPEKAPFAEAQIKIRVPNWRELNAEKQRLFESAVVYQTAGKFSTFISAKGTKKQALPTITLEYWENTNFNEGDLGIDDIVDYLVGLILDDESLSSSYIGFRVTGTPTCPLKEQIHEMW